MILRFLLFYLGFLFLSLISLSRANPLERSHGGSSGTVADTDGHVGSKVTDFSEYSDFEDDDSDSDGLMNLIESSEENINSVMHLHSKRGEILVPCFGMWWPVGGGASYDYAGDYYGDYKKKRRRSRKQKKAAKMKKKKS